MERNVGGLDRTARLVAGPILAVVGVAMVLELLPLGAVAGGALLLVGVILAVTGGIQWCPINRALGVDTCPID